MGETVKMMRLSLNEISKLLDEERVFSPLNRRIFNLDINEGCSLSAARIGTINAQYKKYMKRRSSYLCASFSNHVKWHADNIELNGSYLIGNKAKSESKVFIGSHFAPKSLRGGINLLKTIKETNLIVLLAVTDGLADMLERLGYVYILDVPQFFDGELVMKHVYCSSERAWTLFNKISKKSISEVISE